MINVRCENCGHTIEKRLMHVAQIFRCPKCKECITVPSKDRFKETKKHLDIEASKENAIIELKEHEDSSKDNVIGKESTNELQSFTLIAPNSKTTKVRDKTITLLVFGILGIWVIVITISLFKEMRTQALVILVIYPVSSFCSAVILRIAARWAAKIDMSYGKAYITELIFGITIPVGFFLFILFSTDSEEVFQIFCIIWSIFCFLFHSWIIRLRTKKVSFGRACLIALTMAGIVTAICIVTGLIGFFLFLTMR